MNFSRLFIERPVATTLLMVALLLAGGVAVRLLPVAALPLPRHYGLREEIGAQNLQELLGNLIPEGGFMGRAEPGMEGVQSPGDAPMGLMFFCLPANVE